MKQKSLLSIDPGELFLRFQEGDESAFKILYDRHSPELYLVLQAFTGHRELAEDIVANSFIKLYCRRAAIRELTHILPFLLVVAKNEAIGHYRNRQRQRIWRALQEKLEDREYHDPREDELERDRFMTKIQNLVDRLPPARRKIFVLHFFEGLSVREIANQLKLTERTILNQRYEALFFMRHAFHR